MKKLLLAVLVVAVVTTFALAAMAKKQEVKEKVTTKTTATGDVQIHDVTKFKHGDLWKDDVKFHKWDANGNYMYVINDNKTYRVKYKKTAKSPGLVLKKGQPIHITSTYPLAAPELQNYIVVSKIEQMMKPKK